jgi:lysozyme family protein
VFWLSGCQPPPDTQDGLKPSPTPAVRHVAPRQLPPIATPTPAPHKTSLVSNTNLSLQEERWRTMRIRPQFAIAADKAVMLYLRTKGRYEKVQNMRSNGVPAPVLFTIHMRESDNSFSRHLHEGSSLQNRTRYVPKGRPLPPAKPPFTWESSAEDAVYSADHLEGSWDDVTWSLNKIETYNGIGYRTLGVPSPYLFSGTTVYNPPAGKYVSDGRFSKTAVDQQLGVCAVLIRMKERGVKLKFDP